MTNFWMNLVFFCFLCSLLVGSLCLHIKITFENFNRKNVTEHPYYILGISALPEQLKHKSILELIKSNSISILRTEKKFSSFFNYESFYIHLLEQLKMNLTANANDKFANFYKFQSIKTFMRTRETCQVNFSCFRFKTRPVIIILRNQRLRHYQRRATFSSD